MRRIFTLITLLMLSSVLAFAQNRVVTGTVTDEKGLAIEGASVKVLGSKLGVAADINGNYKISVPAGAVLVFSGTGLVTREVTVGDQSVINPALSRTGAVELTNVIVTAQGIRRAPKELGYSTARLANSELTQGKVLNVANGLTGKVSGLQISTTNNGVNPSTRITLRGNRSILGNNQALLVLDDMPVSLGYLNSINPNDIDNITVLKGASASALYGSQASNGVLIVTTKRGTKGKPVIRYSNTTQIEEIAYLPKLQNRFGAFGGEYDASQYPGVQYFPTDPFRPYVPYENQNYGPEYNGLPITIGAPVRFYNADGTFFDSLKHGTYSTNPNAKKKFFDKGLTIQNDFSVSGGDDKSKFFFSVQDVDVKGIIPGDKTHRDAIRLNGSREIGKFRVDYTAGYTISKTNTTQGSYFQGRPIYWIVINQPSNIDLRDFRNWRTDPFANPNGYFNAYYGNPWWQIDASRLDEHNNDLLGNVSLTYKATDWLSLLARASISRNDYDNKYTREGFKFSDYAISDVYGSGNIASGVKVLDPQESDAMAYTRRLVGDFTATIDKQIGSSIRTKLILGGQETDGRSRSVNIAANSLVIPDFYNISNKVGEPGASENFSDNRSFAAYADLTIGYNDYLFIHGSQRFDWVSILDKRQRSFSYPGVDVSFVFTDAIPSLKGNHFLSFGKLRGAYSRTAQVSIGPYSLQSVFNAAPGFPYGNVAGFTLGDNFANPDIRPEFTTEKEVGIELGFLDNRINFQGAYYHTNTDNQTIPIAISYATGGNSATINSGVMTNDGFEGDLKFTPVINTRNGLRWDFGINFTYINNKVKSIAPGLDEVNVGGNAYAIVGQPYPTIKVNDWQRDSATGQVIVDAKTGYPTLDNSGPKAYGAGNPPYKVGLTTTLSWKGITLSAVADFRSGAVIYNDLGQDLDFTGISWYSTQSGRQRFVIPNTVYQDASGKFVQNTNVTTQSGNENFWASTWNAAESPYLNSADFWKLRELALNYELPRSVIGNVKWIKGINFGIVGRNLFMWKAKENVWTDPEFATSNSNAVGFTNINQTPPTRIFGANLTVNF
jgi:TonB-linked outer membrane protein, SusC/RagA family